MKEFFEVSSVSREDVAEVLGKDKANSLTDSQMERLASKMNDDYCNQLYWNSMKIIATDLFLENE